MELLSKIQPQKPEFKPKKNREEQVAERLAQIPESQRGIYRRAVERKSMAAAVKSFCYECCGYEREEVRLCTDLGCPLWAYRPGRVGSKKAKITQPLSAESKKGLSDGLRA